MWRALFAALLVVGQVVFHFTAFAQCPDQWVRHISAIPAGGLAGSRPGIALDQAGNIFYYGRVSPLVDSIAISGVKFDFPNLPSVNDMGLFLSKFSPSGSLLWLKPISGIGPNDPLDLVVDSIGNIYLGGGTSGSLSLDGIVVQGPDSLRSGYFIIKLNSNGEYLWHKSTPIRGSRCYDMEWVDGYGLICAIPFNGSVTIGGVTYYSDTPEYQDILLVQISTDGNNVTYLNKIGGAGNVAAYNMKCDLQGCVIQGRYSGNLSFGQLTLNSPSNDFFLFYQAALDLQGTAQWAHTSTNTDASVQYLGGLGFGELNSIFSGQIAFSEVDFGDFHLEEVTTQNLNFTRSFIGSMNRSDGQVEWLNPIDVAFNGSSPGHVIAQSGGVWLGGAMFDSTLTYEGYSLSGADSFIIRLDQDHKPECGIAIGGSVGSILRTNDGYVVANLEFDGQESIEVFGQTLTSNGGLFDVAIAKTCLPCDTLTSIAETANTIPTLNIHPNPASQSIRVEIQGYGPSTPLRVTIITITDMLGHAVLHHQTHSHGNTIDISGLANGIYAVAATLQGGETTRTRLVVQR
jgi:hypothetical protein